LQNQECAKKRRLPDEQSMIDELPLVSKRKRTRPLLIDHLELPVFSSLVQRVIDKGELTVRNSDFIHESCDHLLSMIENPVSTEYTMYCAALLEKYPQLKEPGREHVRARAWKII